jgi:hypothetical protein
MTPPGLGTPPTVPGLPVMPLPGLLVGPTETPGPVFVSGDPMGEGPAIPVADAPPAPLEAVSMPGWS